jgi:hypothetical protein
MVKMKVMIRETGKIETLSFIDPRSKTDFITDFIGNQGALDDGQFTYDEDKDAYVCSQENFEWWQKVAADHQAMEERIKELTDEYGHDRVYAVVEQAGQYDLEDMPAAIIAALDEVFAGK